MKKFVASLLLILILNVPAFAATNVISANDTDLSENLMTITAAENEYIDISDEKPSKPLSDAVKKNIVIACVVGAVGIAAGCAICFVPDKNLSFVKKLKNIKENKRLK